jgi:hypothetical protein
VPEEELVVVVYQWNILPGQPSLPWRSVLARILRSL